MRFIIIILLISGLIGLLDFLSFRAINTAFEQVLSKQLWAKALFFSSTGLFLLFLALAFFKALSHPSIFTANDFYIAFGLFVLFFLPKLHLSIFYSLDSLLFVLFKKQLFINYFGVALSVVSLLFVAHGIFINKTNYQVRDQIISSNKLNSNTEPLSIIQISDMHIGSFHNNLEAIQKMVNQVNAEKPDLIVFTGDMVSNYAEEMDEFIPILKQLSAKYGKYAILGNHDYGEYVQWKSETEELANLENLKAKHQAIGFTLLNNKNTRLNIKGQTLQLIGVENWGLPPFPQYGKLAESSENLDPSIYTILLSHDPSHWRAQVLDQKFIDLTLSGHTHAMQFGIEIGSWQFSPVAFKYKEWGGLYEQDQQALYVNRGTGYIGFPGRMGIRPEITKLILQGK